MIRGRAKKDRRTKKLINRLTPHDIAVIHHKDLDEIAATQLIDKNVKAVINAAPSISGRYPNRGPELLCNAGIPIIDNVGDEIFEQIKENDIIEISDQNLLLNNEFLCKVHLLTADELQSKMEDATENLWEVLSEFIENTLTYAEKEKEYILNPIKLPHLLTDMEGKHVLIVTRGKNYKEDLKAIRPYIEEVNPVMIGVDGGGDALMDFGYRPDMIVGDMDSVSDKCLKSCKEIVVHAYPDGRCPGMKRIRELGLSAVTFPYAGTSEDVALIIAFEKKAELIVTVGSHNNMIDFLEKGRRGMASTLLLQMKIGHKVVDAKGVSELYKNRLKSSYIVALFIAALFPLSIVARMSPLLKDLYQLLSLRIKLLLGI